MKNVSKNSHENDDRKYDGADSSTDRVALSREMSPLNIIYLSGIDNVQNMIISSAPPKDNLKSGEE